MKTYKYKTIEGLLIQSENKSISLEAILTGRIRLRGRGWCNFALKTSERIRFAELCANTLGARKTRSSIMQAITYGVSSTFGIYRRLVVQKNEKKIEAIYNAGQCYTAEIATIRRLLLK